MEKSKTSQKGVGKQRPGQEQVQSSTNIQRGQQEDIQQPKHQTGQLKQKQSHGKTGKK